MYDNAVHLYQNFTTVSIHHDFGCIGKFLCNLLEPSDIEYLTRNGLSPERILQVLLSYTYKVSKQKSSIDFVDNYSITKLFLQNYLCTRHIIRCKRMHYKTFL